MFRIGHINAGFTGCVVAEYTCTVDSQPFFFYLFVRLTTAPALAETLTKLSGGLNVSGV